MGFYDKLNKGCKTFQLRTAIKKLKEGKTIRVASWGRTVFRTRRKNTEIWMQFPGGRWTKLGTLKDFSKSEYKREKSA